jgi:hypothetical protein
MKNDHPSCSNKTIKVVKTKHSTIKTKNLISKLDTNDVGCFQNSLKKIFDDYTTTIYKKERFRKPFMNQEIFTFIQIRENYFKLSKKFPWSLKITSRLKYYRNLVSSKCSKAKKEFYNKKFLNDSTDLKSFWCHVNNLLANRDKKPYDSCQSLQIGSTNITNKLKICEEFNIHFSSVAERIKNSITIDPFYFNLIHDTEDYIIKFPFDIDQLESTEEDFLNIIANLKNSDATDYFGFSNNIFKMHKEDLAKPLSILTNDSIKNGIFHSSLKISKITALYKNSGNKKDMDEYRPLSIASITSKCIEDFLLRILSSYFETNDIIHKNQFGFTKGSCTEIATVHVLNEIYNNKEKSLSTAILFIDLKKAFDSVTHDILLKKLMKIKLPDILIRFFKSYFNDRYQYVQIEDIKSMLLAIKAGVFQGSKLAALFFILYINNIFSLPLNGKLFLYADDIAIVYGAKNVNELKKQMEDDLILLDCWLQNHFLLMNLKKTKFIYFEGRAQNDFFIPGGLKIYLNNINIDRVSEYEYLGLLIDEKLSFTNHLERISSKIISTTFAIKRIRPFISEDTAKQLYFQHIQSQLIYINSCWNVTGNTRIEALAVLQRKALRIIFQKRPLFPSKLLFSPKVLPLKYLNRYQITLLTFKLINKLQRSNVNILTRGQVSGRLTRQSALYDVKYSKDTLGDKDFFRRGYKEYNKLPYNLKIITTIGKFKLELRNFLYSEYMRENEPS